MSLPKQPVIPNAPPTSTILTIPPLIPPFTQGGTVWVIPFTQGGHGMGYPFYTRGGYCFTQGGTVWVIPFTQGVGIALHKGWVSLYTNGDNHSLFIKTLFFTNRQKPITESTDHRGIFVIPKYPAGLNARQGLLIQI